MIRFTNNQLTIILAFYYFENKRIDDKKIKKFTDKLNDFFQIDTSTQNISYELTKFKNIDPSFNALPNSSEEVYTRLWKYYIDEDRIHALRNVFLDFKNNHMEKQNLVEIDDNSYNELIDLNIDVTTAVDILDSPKAKYNKSRNQVNLEIRDLSVAFNSLKMANYLCEYDRNHPVFLRKSSPVNYTEGHHLIPLKAQSSFDINLDVEANVVSLCSNCHNQIHYGKDYEVILKKLFNDRKTRLEKCGISISFEDLKKYYE